MGKYVRVEHSSCCTRDHNQLIHKQPVCYLESKVDLAFIVIHKFPESWQNLNMDKLFSWPLTATGTVEE